MDSDDELFLDSEPMEPTLRNIVNQTSLKWVFVGGKGGVGKTTVSSCLAVQLAAARDSVLLVSTDPAHNLSDAFGQQFSKEPRSVDGVERLWAMEVDPDMEGSGEALGDLLEGTEGLQGMLKDMDGALPGMDEVSSFMAIMKQVKSLNFEMVVFDTAPTGHTLRLLGLPGMLEKGVGRLLNSQGMSSILQSVSSVLNTPSPDTITDRLSNTSQLIEQIRSQFVDPALTTFVCVCIPEFLSVYETERLVQELARYEVDTHNVVVNQIVRPDPTINCPVCAARTKIQGKYLSQIEDLYADFHVVRVPLEGQEVRGVPALQQFSRHLMSDDNDNNSNTTTGNKE
eukprot:gb/GECH01007783.1/.p1 GENE.gb/GECH01007783.1/~~gb/GECH01007783.1/.p1  ORF type:complete len:341 (+),score=67.97 gb/GECH01007783.1/:1-1023(+)